jgi:hypothetical protein
VTPKAGTELFGRVTINQGTRTMLSLLRAREWLRRSMIAVETPGFRGATKAHTAGV